MVSIISTSLFFLLCSAFDAMCELCLSVLSSPLTPVSVLSPFQSLSSEFKCDIEFYPVSSIGDLERLKESHSKVYIDLLYNEFLSVCLIELSQDRRLQVISGNSYSFPHERSLSSSLEEELKALIAVAEYIELTRFCLFLPARAHQYAQFFDSKPHLEIEVEFISEDADLESLKLIVHKQVAHFGFTSFLLLLSANSTEKVIIAMKEWSTVGGGLRVLLSTQGAYYMIGDRKHASESAARAAVFLIRYGCEDIGDSAQLLLCEIRKSLTESGNSAFAVMNMRNHTLIAVGSVVNETVSLISPVITSEEEKQVFSYQTLVISINNGTVNPSGSVGVGEFFDYLGAQVALKTINSNPSLLPYHILQIFNVSLGLYEFDYDWALMQISKISREDLGVAMLSGGYSGVAIGVYSLLDNLHYTIPQIGSANTSPALSSISQFPMYSRVVMSDEYLSVLYAQIIKRYDWKHIAIVYSNDTWSTALYNLILAETQRLKVSIGNQNDTRLLQPEPSKSEYFRSFQGIVESKCRVVILILHGTVLYTGIATLYDLGMRRGDILFLATEWLDSNLFEQDDADMRMKISELCHGAIQFYPASLVGDIGRTFASEYRAIADRVSSMYSCFYYDSTYLLAYALDYLIAYGIDYKSPSNLMKSIRRTKFRGCSGIVSLDQGTNDRSPMMYYIWNARVDSEGGYAIVLVGTYDPAGLVLFTFTDEIVWPDGTSIVPTDIRGMFEKCPFDEKDVKFYAPAVITMSSIIFGLSLILIFVTSFIWMKRWNFSANPLQTRAEVSFDDYYVFGTIAVDALQYATMGPLTEEWSHTISYITGLFTAQMESVMDMSKGQFWTVLIITYSVVGLWAMLFFAKKTSVFQRVRCVQSKVDGLATVLLPLIGNLGFLPVISILLSVFQCLKTARGTGLQSTFLSQDCFQNCWVPPHVFYAASSTLCLFLFVPAAVLLRPTWQDSAESLHIHTSPSYLMVKTMYEMTIVAFQNTVKKYNQITHVVLFLIITIAFCGYTIVRKPFGYERANLWHTLSLVGVLWFALLSLITSQVAIGNALTWLGIFGLGNLCIITFGAIWQCVKLPSLLYRKEEVRLFELFKFMFSGRRSYIYLFTRTNRGEHSRDELPQERRIFTFSMPISS